MEAAIARLWADHQPVLVAGLMNLGAAALILITGLWISGVLAELVRRAAGRLRNVDATLAAFFSSIVRWSVLALVAIAVLSRFGVETTSLIAVLGAAALAIGLALQGALSHVAAGVMLILFRPYRIGDYVEVSGQKGVVRNIDIFTTELATLDNVRIVLPNGQCWGAPITNFTHHDTRRIDLDVGVSYEDDIDRAIGIVRDAVAADPRVSGDPPVWVKVTKLADHAVNIQARAWCRTQDVPDLRPDLLRRLKLALDAGGVTIAYPTSVTYHIERTPPKA
jgi:small conductance mechanosensitive channel